MADELLNAGTAQERPAPGGNSDIYTRRYFDSLLIEMRLIDSSVASTDVRLFGENFRTPVMIGCVGHYEQYPDHIYTELGNTAKKLGTVLWLSEHCGTAGVAEAVSAGAKVGVVVKPRADTKKMIENIKAYEETGVFLLASDFDHAYKKDGRYDGPAEEPFAAKSAEELKKITSSVQIPFIVKGVLSVQDAVKSREGGAAGILLSHHHSIMPYSVPPCLILPEVKKAVGKDLTVIADCGIQSGADAFKALALGADAVSVSRAYLLPLKKEGSAGTEKVFSTITDELRGFLSRTGSKNPAQIDPSVLHHICF